MKYWVKAFLGDTLIFGALYLGEVRGVEWAHNMAVFVLTFMVILLTISIPAQETIKKAIVEKINRGAGRPKGFKAYNAVTDAALVLILGALGWYWLAGFYAIGKIVFEGNYEAAMMEAGA